MLASDWLMKQRVCCQSPGNGETVGKHVQLGHFPFPACSTPHWGTRQARPSSPQTGSTQNNTSRSYSFSSFISAVCRTTGNFRQILIYLASVRDVFQRQEIADSELRTETEKLVLDKTSKLLEPRAGPRFYGRTLRCPGRCWWWTMQQCH